MKEHTPFTDRSNLPGVACKFQFVRVKMVPQSLLTYESCTLTESKYSMIKNTGLMVKEYSRDKLFPKMIKIINLSLSLSHCAITTAGKEKTRL